ncbi:MAG: tetratricopeptide repeat protein [Deltaproteobacteria bacterium]|nr:tetratricopeptide repeat protein [Deltaproteobacteria bacterium]
MRATRRAGVRARALAVLIALAAPAVLLHTLASADAPRAKPKAAASAEAKYDPDNVTALSQAMETVLEGNKKYLAKDFQGALDAYKKALVLNPRMALAHYLAGETYLALANFGEAEAAFKAAEEVTNAKEPLVRSHVLFALADCYEREKKWEDARKAWQVYAEHAAKLGAEGGAHPQTGAARLKAIDDWIALDKKYEIVRQRIAAEKDGGAAAADAGPAKPAAPPKK